MRSASASTGMTLIELTMTVAVLAVVGAMSGQFIKSLTVAQVSTSARAALLLDSDSLSILMNQKLEKAGGGVQCQSAASGKSAVARQSDITAPEIIFFHKDAVPSGQTEGNHQVDADDLWIRYRLEAGKIVEEVFKTDRWTNIQQNLVAAQSRRDLPLNPGVAVSALSFTLYSSKTPPQIIQDPVAASYVRVDLTLRRGNETASKSHWVLLKNILAGSNGVCS